ncbi:MAG: RnfABCDGE type electron transport complex subunit D [Bacteroidales bacterium]|jgi:electron transport complex protein RnfD|nr:RnfABCDGE type electron transport complex subunit D [Bacteroidales bacterium]
MNLLTISGSPHVHGKESVQKIMWGVVVAMIPLAVASVLFFGWNAVRVMIISVAACAILEWLIQKFIMKTPATVGDGSAVITGLLLAFNVPSNLDWWIIVIGAIIAIGVAKMSFGGLGKNPFNPALVGRVFLLISFPQQMTTWPKAKELIEQVPQAITAATSGATQAIEVVADATTGATPMGIIKGGLATGQDVSDVVAQLPDYVGSLIGQHGGSLGEISVIAILLGGIFMLFRKIITWHIPVSFLGSAFIFAGIMHLINPGLYIPPMYHLMFGGIMLGAVFMATDMATSPMSSWGQVVFGIGCGLLTMIIRLWGAYPEGVSFAILIMNAFVPLINRAFKPKRFGEKVK